MNAIFMSETAHSFLYGLNNFMYKNDVDLLKDYHNITSKSCRGGILFQGPVYATTIQGQLDFEGGVNRDGYARVYTPSTLSLFVCTYNVHPYMSTLYHAVRF